MIKWFKNFFTGLLVSFYLTEKKILAPNDELGDIVSISQGINEGRLSDDLMKGKLTEEAHRLRWRMYKVMGHSRNKEVSSDGNGQVISTNIDHRKKIKKLDILKPDGEVVVCLFNKKITLSLEEIGEIEKSITKSDLDNKLRTKRRIYVSRDYFPKFEIENYADRLVVSKNDDNLINLDFYISRYPDIYDKRTPFLVKEIEKAKVKPRFCDMLNIKTAGFITNNDVGTEDFLEFLFNIKSFIGVKDYKGYYILRFLGESVINGESVVTDYINNELENKYEKVERK